MEFVGLKCCPRDVCVNLSIAVECAAKARVIALDL